MSDAAVPTLATDIDWPPTLRAELDGTAPPRRPWYLSTGPAFLTLFTWAPFFDSLWRGSLAGGNLLWLAAQALAATVLCFALFYYPTALWGYRTGRRLGVVAASTFGTAGSQWLDGIVVTIGQIIWYAVAIHYAVDATLRGLLIVGLVPRDVFTPWRVGTFTLEGPVFLCTAVFWIFITGMASLLRLTGVIAALMKVYAPVAAILLTFAAIWSSPGLADFRGTEVTALLPTHSPMPDRPALPLILGFFAMSGLVSVEWGAASARRRDVLSGGLIGIVLAGSWAAIMSLVVVAGAAGRSHVAHPETLAPETSSPLFSFRWGVENGVGGTPAAVILVLFGLAALAPACYSSFAFMRRLAARWPRIRRVDWAWLGCSAAWLLVATGWPGRLEAVFDRMGLVFAPAAGAMAGDLLVQRGRWTGIRPGWHAPGVFAWLTGVAIRLVVDSAMASSRPPLAWLAASPITGFAAAALCYAILARLGLERPTIPVETFPTPSGEVAAAATVATRQLSPPPG